jgi:hypothetical protein
VVIERSSLTMSGCRFHTRSKVGVARAKIVQCDQKPLIAEELHGLAKAQLVEHALFEDFDHDAVRRQAGRPQQIGEEPFFSTLSRKTSAFMLRNS